MTKEKLEQFFALLDEIVNGDGPWTSKRDTVMAAASESDKGNLQEFVGWFPEPEE